MRNDPRAMQTEELARDIEQILDELGDENLGRLNATAAGVLAFRLWATGWRKNPQGGER